MEIPTRFAAAAALRSRPARSTGSSIICDGCSRVAIEYKRFGITENAAEGMRRPAPASGSAPVCIDGATQIEALLEAAAELDRDPLKELCEREVIVATFVFAGPRVGADLAPRSSLRCRVHHRPRRRRHQPTFRRLP